MTEVSKISMNQQTMEEEKEFPGTKFGIISIYIKKKLNF